MSDMTLQWLLGWWNLIFMVPFAIALTYLGVYIGTGITIGDADVDADADLDVDVDADIDVDHDFDAAADHDVVHDAAHADLHDADAHDQTGKLGAASLAILHLIGVGKVPLSLLLMILLFAWGISGFAATQYLRPFLNDGEHIAVYAVPFAAWISLCISALGARLFARVFPMNDVPAMSLGHLVGQRGVAVLPINDTFGLARVENPRGAAIQVPCRVAPGEAIIASHDPLIVLRFDRAARVFDVSTPARYEFLRTPLRSVAAGV